MMKTVHMKEYRIILTFLLLLLSFGFFQQVKADCGPKPFAAYEVIGLDESYSFDLLVRYKYDVVPLNADEIQEQINYNYHSDTYPDILNGYQDEDGFASYTLYTNIPHFSSRDNDNTNLFYYGYVGPPKIFKIAIVTESGEMIVSDIVEKQAFRAYFEYDLTENTISDSDDIIINLNQGTVREVYPIGAMILQIVICIIATLLIELGVLYLFKYRKTESYKKAIIVNLITQMLLQAMIIYGYVFINNYFSAWIILILGEMVIFIIESVVYSLWLTEFTRKKAVLYAIVANIASFVFGMLSINILIDLLS